MPILLVFTSVLSLSGVIFHTLTSMRTLDLYFLNSVPPLSPAILTVLYFQFFGVFMSLGLSFSVDYYQYLTISGVCCFICSIIFNRITFNFFLIQNSGNPLLNVNSWRSPRLRFIFLLLGCEMVFYLLGFYVVKFWWFSYYVSIFYFYPLVHIFSAIRRGNRNNFRW